MSKLVPFIVIILIFSLFCGTAGCLSPYETHLKNAALAISNKNYDEAIAEINKALEINPDGAPDYYSRGSCYYHKEEYDLAIADFTKSIELKHKRTDLDYRMRGLSQFSKGDYDSAISDYTKAIEIYPNPLYYNDRGLAYAAGKNYNFAIKDFNIAINLFPQGAKLYSSRADTYIATGQTSLAIADLKKIIELESEDIELIQSAKERLSSLGVTE